MEQVQVLFLGSGDAFSPQGRQQAGYLIRGSRSTVLLDCGATTLPALKRAGIQVGRIDTILISHFHGDHIAGLPFVILDGVYSQPQRRPLCIAGPPGIQERVLALYRAAYRDAASSPPSFQINYMEMLPGQATCIGAVEIEAFAVPHTEREISLGLRVAIDGKRILYSGDSGWTEDLVAYSKDADLFICECSFFETRTATHLDYRRIAENLDRFRAKRIILTHLGEEITARTSEVQIELASDGLLITLQ
jgi:ribonuclease BN (tRNA processing enzyme)